NIGLAPNVDLAPGGKRFALLIAGRQRTTSRDTESRYTGPQLLRRIASPRAGRSKMTHFVSPIVDQNHSVYYIARNYSNGSAGGSMTLVNRAKCLGLFVFAVALFCGVPAFGQTADLAGEYANLTHEDAMERAGGPPLGDYLGIPLTQAGRMRAESNDEA